MMWAKWRCLTLSSNKIKKTGEQFIEFLIKNKTFKKQKWNKTPPPSDWVLGICGNDSKSKYNFNEENFAEFQFFLLEPNVCLSFIKAKEENKMLINPTKNSELSFRFSVRNHNVYALKFSDWNMWVHFPVTKPRIICFAKRDFCLVRKICTQVRNEHCSD